MKIIFQENGKYAIDFNQLTRSTGVFYKTHDLLNGGGNYMDPIRELLLGSGYTANKVRAMSDEECTAEWDEICSRYTT